MIFSKRIRLRAVEKEDLTRYVVWFNDPEVREGLLVYAPMSLAEEEEWFTNLLKRPKEERPLAIDAQQENHWVHIGSVGLHHLDWRSRNCEIGIAIGDKKFWNHGYGTEALTALLDYGFGELNLERMYLRVFDTNQRAIRCYEKVGFVHEGRLRRENFHNGQYRDALLLSVLRDEWQARRK